MGAASFGLDYTETDVSGTDTVIQTFGTSCMVGFNQRILN